MTNQNRHGSRRSTSAQQISTVMTLHDEWTLTGHCSCTLGCQRWEHGCGGCPDLTIYPSIRRDATAGNWLRKQDIYAGSRLHIATPSRWLMEKVLLSMLRPAIVQTRVIPYGVDLSVFHPGDQRSARMVLSLPLEAGIALFVGQRTRSNPFKDCQTMEMAIKRAADQTKGQELIFLCLGEDGEDERVGSALIRFVGFQDDLAKIAKFYQAADLYLHAARTDNFPNTVLEAVACGIPVVATAVGGIPEQVMGLQVEGLNWQLGQGVLNRYGPAEATGILVPPKDIEGMARAITMLLSDDALRSRLADNAARDAVQRFDLENMVDAYLRWYQEILRHRDHGRSNNERVPIFPGESE